MNWIPLIVQGIARTRDLTTSEESLCRSYGMHMLNGRKDGDREGNFMCIANRGRSVVDYVLVNTRIYYRINSFHVITRTESDHFPMTFKIKCIFADAQPSTSAIGNLKTLTYGSCDLHFQPKVHLRMTHDIGLLV